MKQGLWITWLSFRLEILFFWPRFHLKSTIKPSRLVGDTAYGTSPILNWMVNEKHIEPHVRVWDKTQRKDETLSISEFLWNEEAILKEAEVIQIDL
jgi:hypothetical protein